MVRLQAGWTELIPLLVPQLAPVLAQYEKRLLTQNNYVMVLQVYIVVESNLSSLLANI